jgi:predicted nuclease of predicted toxin-antitoxin system
MKLLFDQNISFRILKRVIDFIPSANQVRTLGLENAKDIEIWNYARENGYTIVTFDTDFYDLSLIKGVPPKIIWLRFGNRPTNDLVAILQKNIDIIKDFIEIEEYKQMACLEIF